MFVYNIGYRKDGKEGSFEIKVDFQQDSELDNIALINAVLEKQIKLGFNSIHYLDYVGDTEDEDYNCAVVLDPNTDEIVARFDTFDEAEEWVANSNGKYDENDICARSEVEDLDL